MKLGRRLNPKNNMWEFSDLSGVSIPDEIMQEAFEHNSKIYGGAIGVLNTIWKFKQRVMEDFRSD